MEKKKNTAKNISASEAAVVRDSKKNIKIELSQEEFTESEKCFKEIFDALNDAIYIIDSNANFTDVNKSAELMNGYSREEFIGKTPYFLSAPGKNEDHLIVDNITTTLNGNGPVKFEFWTLHKNGSVFPQEVMLNRCNYFGREVVIAVGRETTDRKVIEETLKESEERYRNLYDNSPTGIYRTTPDGKIVMANQTLIQMLGYDSLDDISQCNLETNFYPKGFSRSDFKELIEKSGEIIGYESSLQCKDKTSIWVRENARTIKDKNGATLFYEGTLEDITERKIAEEELRTERLLFIGGPVIIIKWKINHAVARTEGYYNHISIEYISPNVTQVLGYTPEELVNNMMHFYNLIHPDDVDRIYKEARSFVDGGETCYQQEYRIRDKNGNYRWYFDFTRIIRNSEGRIVNYHGYLFDISDRKEAEEALVKSEKQLRELNAMKDKFFSVIAHDLRSPFQGLLGMASILVDDEFELSAKERSDFTKKLHEGLKTQFALLDNLLTWSRLQRGVIEFLPSNNDLAEDIIESCAVLKNGFEKKNLNLVNQLPGALIAFYDKNMIATVIRNLLSNAIKFTDEGGSITITADECKDDFVVSVKDTGVGIQEENIPKLFRIDTLYSMRGTNDEGGTGLGLILCKEFVEKHSGKIWAESEFEKGSTFSFTIPKKKIEN